MALDNMLVKTPTAALGRGHLDGHSATRCEQVWGTKAASVPLKSLVAKTPPEQGECSLARAVVTLSLCHISKVILLVPLRLWPRPESDLENLL